MTQPDDSVNVPPTAKNVYRKTLLEGEGPNGELFHVFHREILSGGFTEYVTEYMGMCNVQIETPHGMQVMQREFPMAGVTDVMDALARYQQLLQIAMPIVQKKMREEMQEAQKQASRILRTDRHAQPARGQGWQIPPGAR